MSAPGLVERVPALSARLLRWSGVKRGLAVVYHRISEGPEREHEHIVPPVDAKLFEWQLRHLRRRYRLVRASDLPAAARERRRGERFPVAVTFDDDLPSHAAIARPILERVGAPATFFLCGASLDNGHSFWWETLERAARRGVALGTLVPGEAPSLQAAAARVQAMPPADREQVAAALAAQAGPPTDDERMRATDIRSLADAGFEIGFHTARHPVLTQLADDELAHALTEGREPLEAAAGQPIGAIAYPHGQADARVAAAARDAGFAAGFTTSDLPLTPGSDELLIGRIYPPTSRRHFARALRATLVRQVLGPEARSPHSVWHRS